MPAEQAHRTPYGLPPTLTRSNSTLIGRNGFSEKTISKG
jgi:hypothetical protein